MPTFEITSPDGKKYRVTGPEGSTKEQALARVRGAQTETPPEPTEAAAPENKYIAPHNVIMGGIKGAADIGATLLAPVDFALSKLGVTDTTPDSRRASLQQFFKEQADPQSGAFIGGELASNIAGTAGVGGVLAKGVRSAGQVAPQLSKYAPKFAAALESGGFNLGGKAATTTAGKVGDLATRAAAGGIVGGAAAGAIDPSQVGTGATIGAAFPLAVKGAGAAGRAFAKDVSPEVAQLYQRAKQLGIDIPADRIVNSRALNAAASSLNYVPLSGRAAAESRMYSQMNRALSRTFGQDSDNVTGALRKAQLELGDKFDKVLTNNKVRVDDQLLDDMARNLEQATNELSDEGARIIGKQVDNLMAKASTTGEIDGQAAYNIKKSLDRIGKRNSNEAHYARELKKSLMGALNRSLGPREAEAFATLRKQYGNMLDLEGVAQLGAEGGVSIGRLANMKSLKNPELRELADIAAQFIKAREAPHSAGQRVTLGALAAGTAGATGTIPLLAAGVGAGRLANTALNSEIMKNALLNRPQVAEKANALLSNPVLRNALYQANANSP